MNNDIFLISNQTHLCNICIASNAPETAVTAAGELVRVLSAHNGNTPQIYFGTPQTNDICLGAFSANYDNDDEFRLKITDGICWIDGGKRGIIYGAYELLEQVGYRFFAEDCEVMPRAETLFLSSETDISQKPIFEYRCTSWYIANPQTAPRLRLNALLDGKIPKAWGGSHSYLGFVHTLGELAEMEEKDILDGGYIGRQPCLTDEKTFQTVLKNLRRKLADNTEHTIVSVSQNDGGSHGCQCPNCTAIDEAEGTPAGSLLTFVNRIAETLEPEYPKIAFDTLAYSYTYKATAQLRARDNVIVRLCAPACSVTHPLETASPTFTENLRNWGKRSKRLYIWDYTTDFRSYHNPFPNFNAMRKNMQLFADNNVKGIFEQGNSETPNGEFGMLRGYLYSRLLWNPYMSEETFERHINEFMEAYYGKGYASIRRFYDRLMNCGHDVRHINFIDPTKRFVDPDIEGTLEEKAASFLQKGRADFAEARKNADPLQCRHISQTEIQLDIYEWYMFQNRMNQFAEGTPEKENAQAVLYQAGANLYARVLALGISLMSENHCYRTHFMGTNEEMDYLTDPYNWGRAAKYWDDEVILIH